MNEKLPFYKASRLEIFKILSMAVLGAILAVFPFVLACLFIDEKLPTDLLWLFTVTAIGGFCSGLGWYDEEYSRLISLGGIIGFLTGLTLIIIFTDFDLLSKISIGLVSGLLSAGIGMFLVWIDPTITL